VLIVQKSLGKIYQEDLIEDRGGFLRKVPNYWRKEQKKASWVKGWKAINWELFIRPGINLTGIINLGLIRNYF